MRSRLVKIIGTLGISVWLGALPAQAQLSSAQVEKVVEALRQAAPPEAKNDDLYSAWQVKSNNIPRWSKQCTGRELSPSEFDANPTAARSVVTCIIQDALRDEYRASSSELIAVRRVAAWWMTGDPTRYNNAATSPYIEKVVSFYQQSASSGKPAIAQPKRTTVYDRYMQAAYTATRQKDNQTALLYFKRALDERPNDTFAVQAIRNLEAANRGNNRTSRPTPSETPRP